MLGSIFRLIYGFIHTPWLDAPDHQAWEIILEQGKWQYAYLIHYPHEGGSLVVSLLALFLEQITSFSSLVITSYLLDFGIRFTALYTVDKLFDKRVSSAFGVWSILAAPMLIPWSSMSFGLHYLSSVFPFLLLILLKHSTKNKKYFLFSGLILGFAAWFSLTNSILILAFYLFFLFPSNRTYKVFFSLITLIPILILIGVRSLLFDAGFQLNSFDTLSIRGEHFSFTDLHLIDRLNLFPNIIYNQLIGTPSRYINSLTIMLIIGLSVWGLMKCIVKPSKHNLIDVIVFTLIMFYFAYLFGPFFNFSERIHYINYRHLAYITPLLALTIIIGVSKTKLYWINWLFIGICSVQTCMYIFNTPVERSSDQQINVTQATGWIIATKFGHNPETVTDILESQNDSLINQGVGWGICTALISQCNDEFDTTCNKINELKTLYFRYPKKYRPDLLIGFSKAHSENVTPRLDPEYLNTLLLEISAKEDENRKQNNSH